MIELSAHAKRKIKQRDLKEKWVIETVNKPDFVKKGYGNRQIAYKKTGNLYLKVVFIKEKNTIVIITAHFEKGVKLPS